eukprot:TRINITY_DN120825_c0_g1_i1.p1 TRINITY_DN120825_c0_g1~~TRINITY_DN120825_c0_g1_i1.p1  ORF type:complete len:892 (-),score=163.15 TRINITY_DN120825_c0_g1_i1:262-2937(-)
MAPAGAIVVRNPKQSVCVKPEGGPGYGGSRSRLSQSENGPSPARLLSIGGRLGVGQRINGDYELMGDKRINGRPCWLRRARLDHLNRATDGSMPLEAEADYLDERPLYLFRNEMGYWTIAPSLHASGVQVFARNGPDFAVSSPDLLTGTWMVFAHGKARPDSNVVCFRHEDSYRPPDILHLSGCKDPYGQLNGLYHYAPGAIASSRPIFIKDGLHASSKNEKKLIHFSQQMGCWLLSSAVCSRSLEDGIKASVGTGDEERTLSGWQDVEVLARSPVAWTSMSPVHLLPRTPWSVRDELPERLRPGADTVQVLEEKGTLERIVEKPAAFVECSDLRIAQWTGSDISCKPMPLGKNGEALIRIAPNKTVAALGDGSVVHADEQNIVNLLCVHLSSPQGLSDQFHINGDYVRSAETYAQRPVYVKLPETGRAPAQRKLYLFFDDMSGCWYVSMEIGHTTSGVARSPVDWNACQPPLGALWQLRTSGRLETLLLPIKAQSETTFRDCRGLNVCTIQYSGMPRTMMFGGESVMQSTVGSRLCGDFRLVRERYGRRPVYKRTAQVPAGSPSLYLFFEPVSGYWVISTISALAANPDIDEVDAPALYGEILARSGPNWQPFTPDRATTWEVFDREALTPQQLLEYTGSAPDRLLSPLLTPLPWLRLRAVGQEAPPQWLRVGGFGNAGKLKLLNGTYELLSEAEWSSRPAWQRVSNHQVVGGDVQQVAAKFVFFWPETGHWVIGGELHLPYSAMARSAQGCWEAETPDHVRGRWDCISGRVFEAHAHAYVRRQRTATSGWTSPRCSSPASPSRGYREGSTSTSDVALMDANPAEAPGRQPGAPGRSTNGLPRRAKSPSSASQGIRFSPRPRRRSGRGESPEPSAAGPPPGRPRSPRRPL